MSASRRSTMRCSSTAIRRSCPSMRPGPWSRFADKLRYTGYVDEGGPSLPPPSERASSWRPDPARQGSSCSTRPPKRRAAAAGFEWRLLVGHASRTRRWRPSRLASARHGDAGASRLPGASRAGVRVLSQCGYNTAVDLLFTDTPAVLVPSKQAARRTTPAAERLAALGRVRLFRRGGCRRKTLLAAIIDCDERCLQEESDRVRWRHAHGRHRPGAASGGLFDRFALPSTGLRRRGARCGCGGGTTMTLPRPATGF